MKPIQIRRDDTILTITTLREYSEAEHVEHLRELHEIMEQGKPSQIYRWVVINDLTTPVFGSPIHRKRQAQWMIAHDAEIRYRTSGIAFVMTSGLVRTTLTAVFWLAPLPAPHGIFATLAEAMSWAKARDRVQIDARLNQARRAG